LKLRPMKFEAARYFDFERCRRCVKCLTECPVLRYSEEKAKVEKEKLIKGEPSEVLRRCRSCYSCERFCPNDCHPYYLILCRWFERYAKQGIPVRALKALPVEDKNFIYYARQSYTREEKAQVSEWEQNAHSDLGGQDVIFAGCNAQVFPYLLASPLLAGPKVMGEPGLCCGEEYFRMGLFDRVEELGQKLSARYEQVKPGRVIMFCMAGYNMQKHVLPEKFGVKLRPEIVYLGDWLLDKVKKGEIKFTRPLNRKVVIQDSCHGKVLGDKFMDIPRELLRLAGAQVIDMNPCREKQVCCGAADGISNFSPIDMTLGGIRQWRLARKSGADVFVPYCGTCYLMLKIAAKIYPSFMPCLHMLELLTFAAGHPVESLSEKRTQQLMMRVVLGSAPNILSTKKVFPKK